MPDASPRRLAVIGCGSIGQRHLRNLQALGVRELIAHDVEAQRRAAVERELGVRTVERLEQVWSAAPEAVVVAVPTSLHVPVALEAARQGCHLFIEKPVSDRDDQPLRQLAALVSARRLTALVGCNLRFHPGLQAVKRWLGEAPLGRVVALRAQAGQYLPDWHPQEDYRAGYSARRALGGGVLLDTIHELDYVRWLLGEVTEVACFSGTLSRLQIETEDTAAVLLRFASGAIGQVHLDYVQRAYARSCQIIGDEGTILWDYAGEARLYTAASGRWVAAGGTAGWEPNRMYHDEMAHFLACLRGGETPALDLPSAMRVLAIALAARASSATGQAVRLAPVEAAVAVEAGHAG